MPLPRGGGRQAPAGLFFEALSFLGAFGCFGTKGALPDVCFEELLGELLEFPVWVADGLWRGRILCEHEVAGGVDTARLGHRPLARPVVDGTHIGHPGALLTIRDAEQLHVPVGLE